MDTDPENHDCDWNRAPQILVQRCLKTRACCRWQGQAARNLIIFIILHSYIETDAYNHDTQTCYTKQNK